MNKYDEMLELLPANDPRKATAQVVLRFRGWQKVISTNYRAYLSMADRNSRVHSNYKLHGTVTGRMSSEKPNLQNIPKAGEKDWNGTLEKAFIPEDGYRLWKFDYSQLEFREAAAYAEDEELINIFSDASRDIFTEMSKTLGWPRDRVKTLTYATIFGGGATHIGEVFGIGPGAFEIVKRRMNALDREVCDETHCRMVLQIHDCVVFEIKKGMESVFLPAIKRVMENVKEDQDFGVPFKVTLTEWGSKEEIDLDETALVV
jgi:DNA polymerase I-like protein with 3'-5' exonuclease and polymerase domains